MYAELNCLTNFSFLRGASHPSELVYKAAELGYSAIAITDECSFAGIVKAFMAAENCGIHLIIGAELIVQEGFTVIALVTNRSAYSELSALITLARRRAQKGSYEIHLHDLAYNLPHNLLIWRPTHGDIKNNEYASTLSESFGNRLWLGITNILRGDEFERYDAIYNLAMRWQIPMVACGDVQMHIPQRKLLHDTITAIRHNTSIAELGFRRQGNAERYLRSLKRLKGLYPEALLQETLVLAGRCHFSLSELRYQYPPEVVPPTMLPATYLRFLVEGGAAERWPNGVPAAIRNQIERELELIADLHYEYYFLTVHDIVHYAIDNKILCQGRGSAANSVVCYCLRITEVSPEKASLLFERFISKERNEPPDIDVDFEHERREEVIQYIYKKYGRERAALAATVVYYRSRSAIRDVGKALGLDALFIDQLAKSLVWWDRRRYLADRFKQQGCSSESLTSRRFLELVQQLMGFPRHLSQHVGGFVITADPISTLVPVENASMADRTVIQWDKEDLEYMKLLKVDVLALGMLTAIRKTLQLLGQHYQPLRIEDIPPEDPETYEMLQRADSVGVFQVESRAQMAMLPRLKPATYYDLVIEVALVRPGPIQGDMVHPYLRRRQGLEPESYPNDAVEAVLKRTLGIPIFQEQVIKLAMVAAGFSAGEADQLRRAMASWGKNGDLEKFRDKLLSGMRDNGHPIDFAERLFEQMKGFGSYGFPESHAASFALLVYISGYLKRHFPAAFYCGLLNSQPMGFYSPSQLIQDARRHAVDVLPIDVRFSQREHILEHIGDSPVLSLRLGFCLVKGLRDDAIESVISARHMKSFRNQADFKRRTRLPTGQLEALIAADALRGLSGHRHQSHWEAASIEVEPPLDIEVMDSSDGVALPAPTEMQNLTSDYNSTGLTLGRHPMAILRERFEIFRKCKMQKELKDLGNHRFVRIAGIVTGRQRPATATGVIFLTLEDETGNTNVVVWNDVQVRCRDILIKAKVLLIKGYVESANNVIHVIAGDMVDCSNYLHDLNLESRDFH
ncbi:MAG TPA: error-prone DNA polymerase [Halioglobus sp.]